MDFEKAKIEELEAVASENRNTADQYRKRFIEVLFYLRQSGRYKENRKYSQASFGKYLFDRWMITESAFDKERVAYLTFPAESKKLGPGVVAEAVNKCGGAKGAKPVLEEIIATDAKLKRGIKREKIDAIIKEHAVPPAVPVVTMSDMRAEVARLRHIIENRDLTIRALRARVAELDDQLARNKRTINEQSLRVALLKEQVALLESEALARDAKDDKRRAMTDPPIGVDVGPMSAAI